MKPRRLMMQAFGPYADKETIDFTVLKNHQLFLITGPTGSGKTTILDAMSPLWNRQRRPAGKPLLTERLCVPQSKNRGPACFYEPGSHL